MTYRESNRQDKETDMGYYSTVEGTLSVKGDGTIDMDAINALRNDGNSNAGYWISDVDERQIWLSNAGKAYNIIRDLSKIVEAAGVELEGEVIRDGEDSGDIEKFIVDGESITSKKGRIVFD